MKPRSKPATKAEKARYDKLKQLPCIISLIRMSPCAHIPVEIHHLTSGGRRLGNHETIPLCQYHHRAVLPASIKKTSTAVLRFGPSLETSKRDFVKIFGSEMDLLSETNKILEGM